MTQGYPFRVGAATVDITPRSACDLSGFIARQNPSEGVHDPVFVRALTVDDGHTTVALLTCDLLGLEAPTVAMIRQAIERATAIPAAHIVIAASHTHSAPASMFLNGCGTVDPSWLATLPDAFVAATTAALAAARPTRWTTGSIEVHGVAANRRSADGAVDHDLGIVCADDEAGDPVALLLTFACHPVTPGAANRLVSADFPGALTRHIEARTGATMLYATGASADINPAGISKVAHERASGFELVEQIGARLADAAIAAMPGLTPLVGTSITVHSRTLRLPLLPVPTEAELVAFDATQRANMEAAADPSGLQYRNAAAMRQWVARTRADLDGGRFGGTVDAEVQVIAIGDTALVGVPGELWTSLGQQIKQASPFAHTFVATFANGNLGYIPAREAYPAGGYEIEDAYHYYGYPAALAPEAGEMVVSAALDLLATARNGDTTLLPTDLPKG